VKALGLAVFSPWYCMRDPSRLKPLRMLRGLRFVLMLPKL